MKHAGDFSATAFLDCCILPEYQPCNNGATSSVLPAGLGDIVDVREKAVLLHCLHVFCVDCLNRWLPVKRLCPLCKVRLTCCQSRHGMLLRLKRRSVSDSIPVCIRGVRMHCFYPALLVS